MVTRRYRCEDRTCRSRKDVVIVRRRTCGTLRYLSRENRVYEPSAADIITLTSRNTLATDAASARLILAESQSVLHPRFTKDFRVRLYTGAAYRLLVAPVAQSKRRIFRRRRGLCAPRVCEWQQLFPSLSEAAERIQPLNSLASTTARGSERRHTYDNRHVSKSETIPWASPHTLRPSFRWLNLFYYADGLSDLRVTEKFHRIKAKFPKFLT